jgi:hypothetical protein
MLQNVTQDNLGTDGRIILKWTLGKLGWRVGIAIWLRTGTDGELL